MWLISGLGVCIGAMTGLVGAGGSFLTVLLLVHAGGLDIGSAIATSLVVVGGMSLAAVVPYAMEGAVMWRAAAAYGIASMVGASLGGLAATIIPARMLLAIFLLCMVAAAAAMLLQRPQPVLATRTTPKRHLAIAGGGLLLGSLTGMVGLGGGFAVVPLLIAFVGAPVRSAIGTSLLVIGMNTVAGVIGHLPNHLTVDWRVAAYLGVSECGGSIAGAHLAKRVSGRLLRRVFAVVMLVAAAHLLGSALLSRS